MEKDKLIGLVQQAQNGDTEALDALFTAYYNDVYYFALKTVKDSDVACDITQDTFLEIIRTIGSLKEPVAFVTWMKQITYHKCTRYFSKRQDVQVEEDEDGNSLFDTVADESEGSMPTEVLEQEEFRQTILSMIEELSEAQRAAVLLYYFDELTIGEIAQIQGVSEGTVKSRLNYARKAIKKSVESYEKKHDIKLHSIALLPLLMLFFGGEEMPADKASQVCGAVLHASANTQTAGVAAAAAATTTQTTGATAAATVTTMAAKTAATGGIFMKLKALPLFAKIIAGIIAGAIVVGTGALILNATTDNGKKKTAGSNKKASSGVESETEGPEAPAEDATSYNPGQDSGTADKRPSQGTDTTDNNPTQGTGSTGFPSNGHTHRYAKVFTDPTATERGYTTHTCAGCGDSYQDTYIDPLNTHKTGTLVFCPSGTAMLCGENGQVIKTYTNWISSGDSQCPWSEDRKDIVYAVIPDGVTLYNSNMSFSNHENLTTVTIGNGVKTVGSWMFGNCKRLTSVTFSAGVTSIGDSAFYNCTALTSVTIPDNVTRIGESAFWGCTALTSITIPDSVTSIGDLAFYNCTALTGITIPNSVTTLGEEAFCGCANLKSVTLPSGITEIKSNTFSECTSLKHITIPSGLTSIGKEAFENCAGLTNIVIPEGVTVVDESAFENCTALTSVTIPNSLTVIGDRMFDNCTALTSVTIPDNVTRIGKSAFWGCTALTSITIPDSVTEIGSTAFAYCEKMTSVTLGKNITTLGDCAFKGCKALKTVVIPDSVTKIGKEAFCECAALKTVTLGDGITEIGESMFAGCTSLTSITMCENITRIGTDAFYNCTSLLRITIPGSVTSIGEDAFTFCESLNSFNFNGTIAQWDRILFGNANWHHRVPATGVQCTDGITSF